MNWFAFIYLLCSAYYSVIGIITLIRKNKSGANWAFGFICLNLCLWSLLLFLMSMTETQEIAALYRWLMIICWSSLYTLLLYFVLFLSERTIFYNKIWKNILLLLPGIFCFVYYFLTPIDSSYMLPLDYGWAFASPVGRGIFWDLYFTLYYVSYTIMTLAFALSWNRRTAYERERRQSRLILLSFLSILILGSFIDVFLPMISISKIPPMTVILAIICITGLNFAITRYRMMSITPESIMMEVFMMMSEGLIIVDGKGWIVRMNAGAETILGYQEAELIHSKFDNLLLTDSGFQCQSEEDLISKAMELVGKNNRQVHALMSCHTHFDQFFNKIGTVITFQDINELKLAEEALAHSNRNLEEKVMLRTHELAEMNEHLKNEIEDNKRNEEKIRKMIYEDSLTQLHNRRFFYEYLEKHITYAMRYNKGFTVLFIDLDGFKLINDSLGHDMGDQLLVRVAQNLKNGLRQSDVISRAGGDEFLILLHNTFLNEDITQSCRKILSWLEEPISMNSYNLHISASIGIASFPRDGSSSESLIKNADIAMYEAKAQGKGRFVFYQDNLKEDIYENMNLSNDLYSAIENNEFELFYQPQIDATTHEINGFEALIRWNHPERGLISPSKFIPLAERTGLIIPIGEWVVRTAIQQHKNWEKIFGKPLRMGVNLSTNQLKSPEFVDRVEKAISDFSIDPSYLELEITETIFMEDSAMILDKLTRLKKLGVTIAIDDFGTEYSSLSYLKRIPFDRLKIPKNFVDGIGSNEKDEAIIVSTIVLAIKLGCTTIAEGVENAKQLHFLQEHGCEEIQGYYFYHPMPAKQIEYEIVMVRRAVANPVMIIARP